MITPQEGPDQLELFEPPIHPLLQRLKTLLVQRLEEVRRTDAVLRDQRALRREWRYFRTALSDRIVGHEQLIDERLSLLALAHDHGFGPPQRILLCGPSGAGKSHIARVLAETAGRPYRVQDVMRLQESGWQGMHVEDMLDRWRRDTLGGISAIERGVLCLDEVDKLRLPDNPAAVDKRRGEQASLLPLLGTGVPVSVGTDGDQMRPEGMLIVLTGAFSDASWSHRAPTPMELVEYGLIPELVDRLTDVVYVPPQPLEMLARLYSEGPTAAARSEGVLAWRFGYSLEIDPGVFRYAAVVVSRGGAAAGQRAGGHWIASAARRAIARALREDLPAGSVIRVTPDDLVIPRTDPDPPHGNRRSGGGEPMAPL